MKNVTQDILEMINTSVPNVQITQLNALSTTVETWCSHATQIIIKIIVNAHHA